MALDYNSGDGLFDCLGALAKRMETVRTYQGNIATEFATIASKYHQNDIDEVAPLLSRESEFQGHASNLVAAIRANAATTLIERVHAESTLPQKTVGEALKALRALMVTDGNYIGASTVSVGAASVTGTGDGTVVVSEQDIDGADQPHVYAETITLECTQDAQGNSGTAEGGEVFTVTTEAKLTRNDKDWPGGSGIKTSDAVTGPSAYAKADESTSELVNALKNSEFDSFTADDPNDWDIIVGAATTHVAAAGSGDKAAGGGLELLGNGTTLVKIRQNLDDDATGSLVALEPDTKYCLAAMVKRATGLAPAAGILRISLQDSGGTILDSANAKFDVNLVTVGTSYVRSSVVFNTGASIPAGTQVVVEFTTALSSTKKAYVADLVLVKMKRLYPGGPYFAVLRGETAWLVGDKITAAISNTPNAWAKELDRLFDLTANDIVFPTSGGGSEMDVALIA